PPRTVRVGRKAHRRAADALAAGPLAAQPEPRCTGASPASRLTHSQTTGSSRQPADPQRSAGWPRWYFIRGLRGWPGAYRQTGKSRHAVLDVDTSLRAPYSPEA